MRLASAYPSSDISAGTMTIIALVMVGGLVIWLVMVYLAASERNTTRARRARRDAPIAAAGEGALIAAAGKTVEDDGSGADGDYAAGKHGAAV